MPRTRPGSAARSQAIRRVGGVPAARHAPAGQQHRVERGRLRVGEQGLQHEPGPAAPGRQDAGQSRQAASRRRPRSRTAPAPAAADPSSAASAARISTAARALLSDRASTRSTGDSAGPHARPGQPVPHRGQRPPDGAEGAFVPRVLAGQQAALDVVADERHPVRGGERMPVLLPDAGAFRPGEQPGHVQPDGRVGQRGLVPLEARPGHLRAASAHGAPPPGPAASPGTGRWRTRGRAARRAARRTAGRRRGCSRPRPATGRVK